MHKIKGHKGIKKSTQRYIVVRRSVSLSLLYSLIVLKLSKYNHDLPLFHKFDTRILITTKYHTIISFVDENIQTTNKHKILNDHEQIALLSIITCSNSLYVIIHLDPTNFLSEKFPLDKNSIGQLPTLSYDQSLLYFTKVFNGV